MDQRKAGGTVENIDWEATHRSPSYIKFRSKSVAEEVVKRAFNITMNDQYELVVPPGKEDEIDQIRSDLQQLQTLEEMRAYCGKNNFCPELFADMVELQNTVDSEYQRYLNMLANYGGELSETAHALIEAGQSGVTPDDLKDLSPEEVEEVLGEFKKPDESKIN